MSERTNERTCVQVSFSLVVRPPTVAVVFIGLLHYSLHTESVIREAEIQDLGYNIGGRNISNARYADDTALIQSHQWRCSNY